MQKVVDPAAAVKVRLRLRDLVLVVRKLEVHSACVQVDVAAEQVGRHRGALDVPAGAPQAPRRRPRRLARLGRLPQHKIRRMPLVGRRVRRERALALCEQLSTRFTFGPVVGLVGGAGAGALACGRLGWIELAVLLARRVTERFRIEVDGAAALVAVAVGTNRFDVRDDLGHVVGDARDRVGREHIQARHVVEKLRLEGRRQLQKGRLHVTDW